MLSKIKKTLIKSILIILSLIVADACPDFINKQLLETTTATAECTIIESCLDSIYATLFNFKHCDHSGDNDCEDEDSIEIDDHIVLSLTIAPPHNFPISHPTPFPFTIDEDVYIEVIPRPPLFSI